MTRRFLSEFHHFILLHDKNGCQECCISWTTEFLNRRFPGCAIRRLSACTHVPHNDGSSVRGPHYLTPGSETSERQISCLECKPGVPGPRPGTLSTKLLHYPWLHHGNRDFSW